MSGPGISEEDWRVWFGTLLHQTYSARLSNGNAAGAIVDLDAIGADERATRRREQTIQQIAAALPASFTLDYCPEWEQRIAVVAAVLDAKAAVEAAFGGDSE